MGNARRVCAPFDEAEDQNTMLKEVQAPEVRVSQQDTFDIGKIFASLWRGKVILLVCATISVLIGGYDAYVVATPVYSSVSVLMLNTREEQVVDLEGVIGGLSNDTSVVNTELEVLRSRELIGDVVDELGLMQDPEFNAELRPPSALNRVRGMVRRLFQGNTPPPELVGEAQDQRIRDSVITAVKGNIRTSNLQRSLVFRITAETTDPIKSAQIADALAEAYIRDQIEVKFEATEQATEWLTDRVAELQVSLEAAENEVKVFRAQTELVSFEALQALEVQLKTLRDRIRDTESQTEVTAARLTAFDAAATRADQLAVTEDAALRRLLPTVETSAADRRAFDQRFATLRLRTASEDQRARTQLASLSASFAELEAQIRTQNADLISLQQLEREAGASRLLYEYFLNRLKETSAQQGVQQADSRILSRAVVPLIPSAPDKSTILAISGFLGLLLGSAILFWRELRSTTFRISEELEEQTGITVIGQIPRFPVRKRGQAIAYLADKPASAAAEAVRNLRTSVLLSNLDDPPQIIMVTSSIPGEGKTTVSFAMAQNLAHMGKKTLLVEGDIRRQVFGQYLKIEDHGGLTAVMTDARSLEEAITSDNVTGADVLTAGTTAANPADLLSSQRFADLLETLRGSYDHIIIDTPPVLVVPDARITAQYVDASIFVVKWDSTSAQQVQASMRALESVGHRISGFALNMINPAGVRRYGYGANYGAYAAYGAKYYRN